MAGCWCAREEITGSISTMLRQSLEKSAKMVRTRGDHRQYKHPTKLGLVTVSGHRNDDVHPKTLNSILTQAGLRRRDP